MSSDKTYRRLINSKRWLMTRRSKLEDSPLCEICKAEGRVKAAYCVHHVVPVETARTEKEAEELCFRYSNLQSLCYECHANIHKAERSHSKEMHRQRQDDRFRRWINKFNLDKHE